MAFMHFKLFLRWAVLLQFTVLCGCAAPLQSASAPFAILYNQPVDLASVKGYQLLVLDPESTPNLAPRPEGQIFLAYISIGEAKPDALSEAERHLAIRQNPVWKSHLVDVRKTEWQERILSKEVPSALAKGYDGVMLDTVDSPLHLEQSEPQAYAGMTEAAIELIQQIRRTHPQAKIMLNRGFGIWQRVAPSIDMILVESTASDYDFDRRQAHLRPEADYEDYLRQIRTIQAEFPHLKVYSVDYWDMNDESGVRVLYEMQRRNQLIPYVSTPQLDRIYSEPSQHRWPSKLNQRALYGGFDA